LLLCTGVLAVTPGCADSEPFPETDGPGATEGPAPVALPNGGHVLDEYVLQVRPRSHTTKLIHLKPGVSSRPGFNPQSVDALNAVQDNVAGSGPANSVELDTDQNSIKYGATCPSGITASFCGDVTLRSFYTRSLNNVFVQVTSITGTTGNDLSSDHNALNSDAAPSWMTGSSSMGLWKYTGAGMSALNSGVLGSVGNSPSNAGLKTWEFKDPDSADTNILLRVVASLNYKDYTRTTTTVTWVNNCAAPGTNDGTTKTADTPVTLPFGFTFYNVQNTTSGLFNRDGVAALGGASPPPGDNVNAAGTTDIFKSVTLPENPASISTSPGIYVFWDELNYNSASSLCHGTTGTAPNRQFQFTWRNMRGFGTGANTTNLNFAAILYEGSDVIDMVYGVMNGAAGTEVISAPTPPSTITNLQRAQGKKAVIGLEGPNGATNSSTPFPAAAGGTVIPISTVSPTNVAYRYTPVP
jgi:hypothetical protein